MSTYSTIKEVNNDIRPHKGMRILLTILLAIIVIFATIAVVKIIIGEPVKLFGSEFNQSNIKHDTVRVVTHDTIYLNQFKGHESVSRTHTVNTNVTSTNQQGGQTANQINNNY